MTPADFIAWRSTLGISSAEAARRLGVHANTVTNYSQGNTEIPVMLALACSALAAGLGPWSPPKPKSTRGRKAS